MENFHIRVTYPKCRYNNGIQVSFTKYRKDLDERGMNKLWNLSIFFLGCEVIFVAHWKGRKFPRFHRGMGLKYCSNIHRIIAFNRGDHKTLHVYQQQKEVRKYGYTYVDDANCQCCSRSY